ncbi:hypothetical protein D1007_24850 [Hordeum vulgare]|nr:hypothetical protein D1007_24850 [Hordeum vulgare]
MSVDDYATTASNLFYEMGERDNLHNATAEFVNLLADNTMDIEQAPIGYYGYNKLDGGLRDYGQEHKAAFDQELAKIRCKIQKLNSIGTSNLYQGVESCAS